MEQKLVQFIKFHGYLFFIWALFFAVRELWLLTVDALYLKHNYWMYGADASLRCHPTVRWIFALLWLVCLAVMYSGLKWEDRSYLKPVKYLFLVEVLNVLVQDLLHTYNYEPNERLLRDFQYLFIFSAIVGYVLYTFYILGLLLSKPTRGKIATSVSKVAILNSDGTPV